MTGIDDSAPRIVTFADLQRALNAVNKWRLSPSLPTTAEPSANEEREHRKRELGFVETERAAVTARAADAPTDPDGFVAWFERLERNGPGQHDPLFEWLETDAPLEAMKWFLRQEVAGEAGFDDLVALTQVKMPPRVKLELARNFWDEMGQGHAAGMHGPMLTRLADELDLETAPPGDVVPEALAVGNLLTALAVHRRYAYQSIGALGVIELTAPGRAMKVNSGLKRLGISGEARRYFALHATLDIKHSESWNREVLRPLICGNPQLARPIAEGALIRLAAGARCFGRYRRELGLSMGRSHSEGDAVPEGERGIAIHENGKPMRASERRDIAPVGEAIVSIGEIEHDELAVPPKKPRDLGEVGVDQRHS
jgi:Iron-containing redox enzyme